MLRNGIWKLGLALGLVALCGCQSLSWPNTWPFPEHERTSYLTPAMRVDAISQLAAEADGTNSPEQRQLADQLARQIQIEPDPLVRRAIVDAISEFQTPLAQQVLRAGLKDENASVRIACCKSLGRNGDAEAVDPLAQALRNDSEVDVRLAAAEALGNIKSPQSMEALIIALDDRDPALQYVGVQSLKSITGEDYGGDVRAWRQVASGEKPPHPEAPSLAKRLRSLSPL